MHEPGQISDEVVKANMVYSISLLNQGHSPEEVQSKLVERGLTEEEAAGIVYNLLMQSIYTDAVDMLNRGLSRHQVIQQLITKGLEQQTAESVVQDILEQNRHNVIPRQDSIKGVLLKLLGGAVFIVGIGLLIGNITGGFPTFPYAGFIVMGIGSFIWGASEV